MAGDGVVDRGLRLMVQDSSGRGEGGGGGRGGGGDRPRESLNPHFHSREMRGQARCMRGQAFQAEGTAQMMALRRNEEAWSV